MTHFASIGLSALCREYLHAYAAAVPQDAARLGVPGYADRLPDPSRDGDTDRALILAALLDRLEAIDPTVLPADEAMTRQILAARLTVETEQYSCGLADLDLTPGPAGPVGIAIGMEEALLGEEAPDVDRAARHHAGAQYLHRQIDRYRQAADDGRYPTRRAVATLIDFTRAIAPRRLGELRRPRASVRDRARAVAAVNRTLRPALHRLVRVLETEIGPHARDDARPGLCYVIGGHAVYAALVGQQVGPGYSPDRIHTMATSDVDTIKDTISELGSRAYGLTDVGKILARLHDDPTVGLVSPDDILRAVTDAMGRGRFMEAAGLLRSYDVPELVVTPMAVPSAPAAGYWPDSFADPRPRLLVNVASAAEHGRHVYPALVIHEGFPGHHLQHTLAHRNTQRPVFRRYLRFPGHSEGWATYMEGVAAQAGAYRTDQELLARWSAALTRACGAVIDTGIHYHGWTSRQANQYATTSGLHAIPALTNLLEGIISHPGRLLAYYLGEKVFTDCADRARRQQDTFDPADYHDALLSAGSVPLSMLDQIVTGWLATP